MTNDNPAQTLRAAAEKLREATTEAIHDNRTTWRRGHTLGTKSAVVLDDPDTPTVLIETYAQRLERVNAYLELVGPATGLAIAEWLDSAADAADLIGHDHHALAVARQLLDEVTE